MSAAVVVFVSERRLLVDALTQIVEERLGWRCVTAQPDYDVASVVASNPEVLVVIDLESPGAELDELQRALSKHDGRRCGVYDRFTADIAARAFDLGIGVPVSLKVPIDSLVESFRGIRETSVVTAVGPTRRDLDRLAQLSPRELEVMEHIAAGETSVRTAALLGITPHTVDTHRRRAIRKLGATNQSQAVAMLARMGALTRPQGDSVTAGDRAGQLRRRS